MIGEWIRFSLTALCLVAGCVTLLISVIGTYRFNFALDRIHAAAMTDTLALSLILIGVMIAYGDGFFIAKLLLIVLFQWCSSPLSSHMLMKLEFLTDPALANHCRLPEPLIEPEDNDHV